MPTTSTSIYTPSLSSRTSPLSCSELAHIILTSFSKPSIESRHLVSLILQSIYEYTDAGSLGLIDDDDLKIVSTQSHLLMAVASRLEVDLKNEVWSGDLLMDVRRMYHRIIFRIMQFLIETSGGSPLVAVNIVRSTLANTRRYLATSTTRSIERDIAITARKYGISYTREAMIEDEVTMLSGPQGPMTDDVRATRMKTGPKSAFKLKMTWGKKSAKGRCKEEREWAEVCETDSCSVSEGAASDSGVSIGESDSEDEKGWDEEEVGVAF